MAETSGSLGLFGAFFGVGAVLVMWCHIIAVGHEIFSHSKKKCNTDDTDQCLGRLEMFHDHLPCSGKKKNLHNGLGGMAAEHFYKLHAYYQR